jgi:hypothetical protein
MLDQGWSCCFCFSVGCCRQGHKTILPAKKRFATVLSLAALRPQKLALRAQTVCAAVAPLR